MYLAWKALILSLLLFSCQPDSSMEAAELILPQKKQEKYVYYEVESIVDGDTFWIRKGSGREKIRLIGIDAPETRATGKKQPGYYGTEAKAKLNQLIGGRSVRLEYDVQNKDRYRRTLAYVYTEDGKFVNAELVKHGYARILTVPPNIRYQELFLKLERKARNRQAGLWAGGR